MVKKLTVFAILASMAMAAPSVSLEPRTFGKGFFGGKASGHFAAGLSTHAAGALAACRGGAASGSVDAAMKGELLAWLNGAGAAHFDFATCAEMKVWCKSSSKMVLDVWAQMAIDASLAMDMSVSAAGSVMAFLNGVMYTGFEHPTCLCQVLSGHAQSSLLTFLTSSAAAEMDVAIRGALHTCALGGIAASLSSSAQASLAAWVSSTKCTLEAEMKAMVLGWLSSGAKGSIVGSVGGSIGAKGSDKGSVGGSAGFTVVLTPAMIADLQTFIGGSAFGGLDVSIQTGLHSCAAGGVSGAMDLSISASMAAWLASPSCSLDAGLKASMGFWLHGTMGAGVQAAGTVSLPYVAVGGKIAGNVNVNGSLTMDAQASLSGFLSGSAGMALDAGLVASLKGCAAGGLAADLDASAHMNLSAWLSGSTCSLSAELRGSMLAWMAFGISVSGSDSGCSFSSKDILDIKAAMSASADMTAVVKGALGVVIGGEAVGSCSLAARAEMSAYLLGEAGATFAGELHGSLLGFLCGGLASVDCGSKVGPSVPLLPSASGKVSASVKASGYPVIPVPTESVKVSGTVKATASGYPVIPAPSVSASAKVSGTVKASATGYPVIPVPTASGKAGVPSAAIPGVPVPTVPSLEIPSVSGTAKASGKVSASVKESATGYPMIPAPSATGKAGVPSAGVPSVAIPTIAVPSVSGTAKASGKVSASGYPMVPAPSATGKAGLPTAGVPSVAVPTGVVPSIPVPVAPVATASGKVSVSVSTVYVTVTPSGYPMIPAPTGKCTCE